jgi:hypothetical protein
MKTHLSESIRPSIGTRIRAWWSNGQSNVEREIMGSSGEWDPAVGEPREIMAGRTRREAEPMPYLMSSPGSWDASAAGPQDITTGGQS